MRLHTDQSPEAQKAAWEAAPRCPCCLADNLGWWQGCVGVGGDEGPFWVCAICACLWNLVPPPPGFLRFVVHQDVLLRWGVPRQETGLVFGLTQPTASLQAAMPLLLAWMIENGELDEHMLRKGFIDVPGGRPPSTQTVVFPVVLRRPVWLSEATAFLDAASYAFSEEDRDVHAVVREVIGNPEWTRTSFSERGGIWAPHEIFCTALKETHPAHQEGLHWAEVLPWGSIRKYPGACEVGGSTIQGTHRKPVDEAIHALVRPRFAPAQTPLWVALGLK